MHAELQRYIPRYEADQLRAAEWRIQHINTVRDAGGVAFILHAQEELQKSLGIDFRWDIMQAEDPAFFAVTKKLHNDLHTGSYPLTPDEWMLYTRTCRRAASMLDPDADIIVLHDPQTIGMARYYKGKAKLVWRVHIEAQHGSPSSTNTLRDMASFVHLKSHYSSQHQLTAPRTVSPEYFNFYPGIDPMHAKNTGKLPFTSAAVLLSNTITDGIPTFSQVSRFDPIKEPWGCLPFVEAYYKRRGDLRFAFVGTSCGDSPDGTEVLTRLQEIVHKNPLYRDMVRIHAISNEDQMTPYYYQKYSTAVFQNSRREGFGLVVAEALYKGTPVLGRAGALGIEHQLQMAGRTEWLYGPHINSQHTRDLVALRMRDIVAIRHSSKTVTLGETLRNAVRDNFTSYRECRDWVALYNAVLRNERGLLNNA